MKLATTMGIELSYCATAIQTMYDRGVRFNHEERSTPGEDTLCSGLATVLRNLLEHKKISYYKCGIDPSCVEVSTKPYRKLETLINISQRVLREAQAIGLTPRLPYTVGGGAHIHTGVVGEKTIERENYTARMMVFAAKNPWLSWAFGDIYDDRNRNPINRYKLIRRVRESDLNAAQYTLSEAIKELAEREKFLHKDWTNGYDRDYWTTRVLDYREVVMYARRKVQYARKPRTVFPLSEVCVPTGKNNMFRHTFYGRHGTIEMRMFDMGDSEQLAKQIKLADAIVKYVSEQTYMGVDATELPTTKELKAMPWRVRRDGFINMLRTLGLDPDDYRVERVRIAERMRYRRTIEQPTPHIVTHTELTPVEDTGAIIERARARHQRRHRA